ncbi:MAG: hypothetical protein IJE84_04020 [Clostridia bacterium]|nr:hypothetical protein [Clostridia bacterium]
MVNRELTLSFILSAKTKLTKKTFSKEEKAYWIVTFDGAGGSRYARCDIFACGKCDILTCDMFAVLT